MAQAVKSNAEGRGQDSGISAPGTTNTLSTSGLNAAYEHLRSGLERQHAEVDRTTTRAVALLGVAGVVVTLGAAASPVDVGSSPLESVLLAVGFVLFLAVATLSYRGWKLRAWRWDPDPLWLWRQMSHEDEATIKLQTVHNMAEAYEHNDLLLEKKLASIRGATWLLILEVGYVFSVLIVLPYL